MASIDFCGSLRVHQQQLKRQPMERIRVDIRRKFKDGIEVSEKFRDKRLQHDKENGSAEEYNLLQVYHCWSLKLNGFIGESKRSTSNYVSHCLTGELKFFLVIPWFLQQSLHSGNPYQNIEENLIITLEKTYEEVAKR
ncbi:hypothetical protein OsJ_12595 [Oryza sativa Japonica Group]|uniref:Uncharacterized protein n=1 Tax=Oryza sativa subsp. japonica TaxID=39947 RepID=A3AMS0_ORYSJ|nr:hypothetical protein OsJ_12595 [Oryza sativa Japonica Group]